MCNFSFQELYLIENGKVCQTAILKEGDWYLFSDETNADDIPE